ncbi:MAG: CapA family protein, partial [Lachnospiraceae bacterium]|nr:CapA family protein [Lachnospiraceae bacterium]
MKKKLSLFLSIILIVALVGCTAGKKQEQVTTPTASESTSEQPTSTQEPTTEEPTTPPEPEPVSIDIIMVGDMLMHTRVNDSGLMADGTYNYDHIFAQVKDLIETADIAIVNQETIIGGRSLGLSGYPAFNSAFELADSIVDAGFDVVLHATNHALDKRKNGLLKCLEYWDTTYPNLGVLGIHD